MLKTTKTLIASAFLMAATAGNVFASDDWKPKHVEIKNTEGKFGLVVDGKPFKIKGAGLAHADGSNYAGLAEAGGNTFRTWDTSAIDEALAAAEKYNLMVLVGLDVDKELHAFDYNDEAAVKAQYDKAVAMVEKYKNHPNILAWIVGNELNLLINHDGSLGTVNPKVYHEAGRLIDYIHKNDPNHPVTYTFAGMMKEHLQTALAITPQVDFVSVQTYGGLGATPQEMATAGVTKPYMITEYGPVGHWEMPSTEWGREIEEPSGPKARGLAARIKEGIDGDTSGQNIGDFVFLWGQKQERTPTWYGMYNKTGEATARIDEMTKYWTGSYPENRAPLTEDITLDGKHAVDNIYVKPGSAYSANVVVTDPNGDPLKIEWVIQKEVVAKSDGGAYEKEPETLKVDIVKQEGKSVTFNAPKITGDYRLFAYVYDGKGKVGNANIPFYVK